MKKFISLLLVVTLALTMVASSAMADAASNSASINITTEPPQMCSIKATDTVSFNLMRHLLVGLCDLDPYDQPIPGVAESWTISDDGLVYTFKLRADAVWEDGQPVTAGDFFYAWTQLITPANACEYASMATYIKNADEYYAGNCALEDVGMKVIDDATFEVTLSAPTAYFLSLTAFGVFMPLRQDWYEKYGDSYGTDADKFIGNGAYRLESWTHESEIVMAKSETYWDKDSIKLDKITGMMVKDANTYFNMFDAGEIDVIQIVGEFKKLAEDTGYTPLQYSDGSSWYLQFNIQDPYMSNYNIRKALSLATDRQSYVDYVLNDGSLVAHYYTSPDIKGADGKTSFGDFVEHDATLYDAEKAREYLAKGLEELGITAEELFSKVIILGGDTTGAIANGTAFQGYWKEVFGYEVAYEGMPFKSRLQRMTDGTFSVVLAGWGPDYNDPLTFLEIMQTGNGNNRGKWSNAEYDELIDAARIEPDAAKRMEMLYKAESILLGDVALAPYYFRMTNYLVADGLQGVVRTAFQDFCFKWASWAE